MRPGRGMALAVTLVVLLILSVMGLALAAQGVLNLDQIEETTERAILLNAANGGLHELMDQVYQNTAYGRDRSASGGGTYTSSRGTAYYWWTFNPADPGFSLNNLDTATAATGFGGRTVPPLSSLVVVNADFVPKERSRRPVRVAAVCSKNFRMAVAADGTIRAENVRGVSGYPGNMWSNASGPGITVSAASADGQVYANAPDGSISIAGTPSGIKYHDAGPLFIPDIPIDEVIESQSPLSLAHPHGGPATYASLGDVTLATNGQGRLDVQSGVLIGPGGARFGSGSRIDPPAEGQPHISILVNGDLTMPGNATLAPSVHLFVRDDMTVKGSTHQLPTGNSDNFLFVGGVLDLRGASSSDLHLFVGKGIKQSGSSSYQGVMYVRDGYYQASGGGASSEFRGVVLINSRTSGSGNVDAPSTNFTYDPDFLMAMERFNISIKEESPVFTLSWWVLE